MQMVSNEFREKMRQVALARWADPVEKEKLSNSIKKPPNCSGCGETDLSMFHLDKLGRRLNKYCKKCRSLQEKEKWNSKSAVEKFAARSHKYGVTKEFLTELYLRQNGHCAICKQKPTGKRGLAVDHCHKTGRVRGLLCHGCNVSLGQFKDDISILNNAIEYLRT